MTVQNETKACQNCKADFQIEPDDFDFYKKIDVPAPTWCPDCRLMRRMSFRNELTFYKRACDLCQKDIISVYSADTPFPVYCRECWWSDEWDSRDHGRSYDFDRDFFSQFQDLLNKVPRPALIGSNNTGSPYVNYTVDVKNCYYAICSAESENCGYTYRTFRCKECFECFGVVDSEYACESSQCSKLFQAGFAQNSENAINSLYVSNCKNVSDCLGCVNLKNKQLHHLNQPVSKEEHKEKRQALGSYAELQKFREKVREVRLGQPHRFAEAVLTVDSSGNELAETKNCRDCFFVRNSEDLRRAYFCGNVKESRDLNFADNSELIYESSNIEKNYNKRFSFSSWFSNNISYCDLSFSSSNLFGCIGLRSKEYCILNKQYSKEEYEQLLPKIIEQMKTLVYSDRKGRKYGYGEFFPPEISPFAYNETVAQEYFPLTEEAAAEHGYRWKSAAVRTYKVTLPAADIPDHIKDVEDSAKDQIIGCAHGGECNERCASAFRITPEELSFYRQMNLPLPRLCPNCRHYQRLEQRNPLKLWPRQCQCAGKTSAGGLYQNNSKSHQAHSEKDPCPNQFETSYAPDRPEIIYCEQCYNAEVA